MSHILGIDLGTTHSVVAVAEAGRVQVIARPDGSLVTPSVVWFGEDQLPLVGAAAQDYRLIDAENTVYAVKRLLGRPFDSPEVERAQLRMAFQLVRGPNDEVRVAVRTGQVSLTEVGAHILREVRRVAERGMSASFKNAVITVPANFNELQRAATRQAGEAAGLKVERMLNEPTAAALAYGCGKSQHERVAIYDFGGGTFDCTILDIEDGVFEVRSSVGDSFLGGNDVDLAIATHMANQFDALHRCRVREFGQSFDRLRAAAEWVKCQLARQPQVTAELQGLESPAGEVDFVYTLDREGLVILTKPILDRTLAVCSDALERASMKPDEIDVVLSIGGSSRLHSAQRVVTGFFGKKPRVDIDPDLVVAQGAAIHAEMLASKVRGRGASLGRLQMRKVTVAELSKLTADRAARRQGLPQQPAFVPGEGADMPRAAAPASRVTRSRKRRKLSPEERAERRERARQRRAELGLDNVYVGGESRPPDDLSAHLTPSGELDLDSHTLDNQTPGGMGGSAPASSELIVEGPASSPASAAFAVGPSTPLPDPTPEALPRAPQDHSQDFEVDFRSANQISVRPSDHLVSGGINLDDDEPEPDLLPELPAHAVIEVSEQEEMLPSPEDFAPESSGVVATGAVPSFADTMNSIDSGAYELPVDPVAPIAAVVAVGSADEFEEFEEIQDDGAAAIPDRSVLTYEVNPAEEPLLLDVCPHSLCLETAGGYCASIIGKDTPIPTRQTRTFATSQVGQTTVVARIGQGESPMFEENQWLGVIELTGLRPDIAGKVQIQVTFFVSADGTLSAAAQDLGSGRQQAVTINLRGTVSEEEMARMQAILNSPAAEALVVS